MQPIGLRRLRNTNKPQLHTQAGEQLSALRAVWEDAEQVDFTEQAVAFENFLAAGVRDGLFQDFHLAELAVTQQKEAIEMKRAMVSRAQSLDEPGIFFPGLARWIRKRMKCEPDIIQKIKGIEFSAGQLGPDSHVRTRGNEMHSV